MGKLKLKTATLIIAVALLMIAATVMTIWITSSKSDHTSASASSAQTLNSAHDSAVSSTPSQAGQLARPISLAQFDLPDLKSIDQNGRTITALCADAQNQLWAGTENDGLRRYNPYAPSGKRWTVFNGAESVGKASVCSLGVDRKGRLWVGLQAGGVVVFDGSKWQSYDTVGGAASHASLSGPLGSHIFQIKVCPTDGAVWLATDAGLTRFDDATGKWSYFTRVDGLPSDATNSITFDSIGDIFVGTQCDGIVIAESADGYKHWRTVGGPSELTTSAAGDGLASVCINGLATTPTGVIYAATNSGMAWSTDKGKSWQYQHGRTWVDRLKSRPGGLPPDWTVPDDFEIDGDLIHRVSVDQTGHLYLAYEAGGMQKFTCFPDGSPTTDIEFPTQRQQIRTLPADMTQFSVAGGFGMGVVCFATTVMLPEEQPAPPPPGLPPGASTPSLADLSSLLPSTGSDKSSAPTIITLDDDWRTRGTWLGRYGRDWIHLPGVSYIYAYFWGAGEQPTVNDVYTGPGVTGNVDVSYFYDGNYTDNPGILELPPVFLDSRVQKKLTTVEKNRSFGELNDSGYMRKASFFGPGFYYDLTVPNGPFVVSMYLVNNDGQRPGTAERDISIEIRNGRGTHAAPVAGPPIAHARVYDFNYGVWKRFYVRGPCDLSIRLQKQTIPSLKFSAVALDRSTDMPAPYFSWQTAPQLMTDQPAGQLAEALRTGPATHPMWWATQQTRASILLARWCEAQPASSQTTLDKSIALYNAGLFDAFESCQKESSLRSARDVETSLRWNQKYPDNSGFEARDLKEYIDEQKPVTPTPHAQAN